MSREEISIFGEVDNLVLYLRRKNIEVSSIKEKKFLNFWIKSGKPYQKTRFRRNPFPEGFHRTSIQEKKHP